MSIFPIPWQEALQGCRLSIENAERLAGDSQVLRKNGRLQSAYSVSLDAWEELGKAIVLYTYYKAQEPISRNDWERILTDHKHKRVAWVTSVDIVYGTAPPKSVTKLKEDLEKHLTEDWRKWFKLERDVGVYVDWVGGKEPWVSPCRIDKKWFSIIPFDSEYWATAVIAQCGHFRERLPTNHPSKVDRKRNPS
jgi:AbiV family abortive infection protein